MNGTESFLIILASVALFMTTLNLIYRGRDCVLDFCENAPKIAALLLARIWRRFLRWIARYVAIENRLAPFGKTRVMRHCGIVIRARGRVIRLTLCIIRESTFKERQAIRMRRIREIIEA